MTEKRGAVEEITIAMMLDLKASQSIDVPEKILHALKPSGADFAVAILTPNTRVIRIIPTTSNKISKITIEIGKLTSDFLREVANLFLDLGLKTLYSTGLCFVGEECLFEGYIDSEEFGKIDIEKLTNEIMKIKGISSINIAMIEYK